MTSGVRLFFFFFVAQAEPKKICVYYPRKSISIRLSIFECGASLAVVWSNQNGSVLPNNEPCRFPYGVRRDSPGNADDGQVRDLSRRSHHEGLHGSGGESNTD